MNVAIKFLKHIILKLLPDKILFSVKKIYYAHSLKSISDDEEIDFKIVRHLVKPDDYVVDIGANIGYYAKFLSHLVGDKGIVYCFEPVPLTFEILTSNLKKLKLSNVKPFNYALSDTTGFVTMEIPLYEDSNENYYMAKIVSDSRDDSLRHVKAELTTVDLFFSNSPRQIVFIKCDVEGHEYKCIRGAVETINKFKPACLIEISGNPDDSNSETHLLFKFFTEKGYDVFWFDGTKLNRRQTSDTSVNYFFLTKKHLHFLNEKGFI